MKLNPVITSIEEEGAFAVSDKAAALAAAGADIINLGIGQPDLEPAAHIIAAAEKAARDGPHGYTSPVGIPALREAVGEYVEKLTASVISPDQVIIVPGGKVTIYFAAMLFGGTGAEILYPDPGFPPYREAIRASKAQPVAYPIRETLDFGFNADELLELITAKTRLIIINSPANPTGGVVSQDQMDILAKGLEEYPDVAVLSDEIYSQMNFTSSENSSMLQYPHLRDRVILLDGWSKTFGMTGWRLGYGIWPLQLVEHVRKLVTVDHSCVNNIAQMAGLAAITGPMDEICNYRAKLNQRRKIFIDGLSDLPGISCAMPGGAFYAFPNITATGMDSRLLADELLNKAHVATIPGDSFGTNGNGFLRLSYAAPMDDLERALGRIKQFLHEFVI